MMLPLCPAMLVASAMSLVDRHDCVDGTPAAMIQRYLQHVGAEPDDGWSAAFVLYAGYWSHFDSRLGKSAWPLPPMRSCEELRSFALRRGVLASTAPQRGDIYLLWSPSRGQFVRAGIILESMGVRETLSATPEFACVTIDGDSDRSGSLAGPHTLIVQRRISPGGGDRLVRWSSLGLRVDGDEQPLPDMPTVRALEGDTTASLSATVEKLSLLMKAMSLRLADGDTAEADDLRQEAMIRLWDVDPSRVGADESDYLARAVMNRMIDVYRAGLPWRSLMSPDCEPDDEQNVLLTPFLEMSEDNLREEVAAMAKPPKGPGRKGSVKRRSQVLNPYTKRWTKRDARTGRFMDGKDDHSPFKGVRKER